MNNQQTDNDKKGFSYKVSIREKNIHNNTNVLDAYSGMGFVWSSVKKLTKYNINIVEIDNRKDKKNPHLSGDNTKFLLSMNLNNFDAIDLDAYGMPIEQLDIVFKKKFKGTIFITYISSMAGKIPDKLLLELGYTKSMIKKAPSMFNRNPFEKLLAWLWIKEVKTVSYYNINRKYYICIKQ